ncbi:MAG: class II fructose-bisphosphatase [Anaerolineales bacterium]|nr:class II fructose-bisphosphatase [Chloroflexota bacterium]MBL6979696.1 class II fructose-bisphosphatase [Anaerolineales bacterium]
MSEKISPNLGLSLVRVTEAAALAAGRWMGCGNETIATRLATDAMACTLKSLDIDGYVVVGEEGRLGVELPLNTGAKVGSGLGPEMDVVADPIDGTARLIKGLPGALSVAGIAPRGSMWSPYPAVYMEKIVVGAAAAEALVPECMDAPAAWTLALVARAMGKPVRDLVVFVLDRPRHKDLISEIQATGARVMAHSQGDIAGALMAASDDANVDILMGIGGIAEGVIAACAVKALRGAMLGRLAPQTAEERAAVRNAEFDTKKILSCDELVKGENIFFAATGITGGVLLSGVKYHGNVAKTMSLILRCETGTRRIVRAEHIID